jgi:hypothetical protein
MQLIAVSHTCSLITARIATCNLLPSFFSDWEKESELTKSLYPPAVFKQFTPPRRFFLENLLAARLANK